MANNAPDFDTYAAAIQEHGEHQVTMQLPVLDLTMLISSLQLALRHPHYPEGLRTFVEPWLAGAIEVLSRISPVIAATMEAGNDRTLDVPEGEDVP